MGEKLVMLLFVRLFRFVVLLLLFLILLLSLLLLAPPFFLIDETRLMRLPDEVSLFLFQKSSQVIVRSCVVLCVAYFQEVLWGVRGLVFFALHRAKEKQNYNRSKVNKKQK